jgi:hypothetical protein
VNATEIRQSLLLTMNNVPFDVAFSISGLRRTAFAIILSELSSGKRYNFQTRSYEEVK